MKIGNKTYNVTKDSVEVYTLKDGQGTFGKYPKLEFKKNNKEIAKKLKL